MPPPSQPDNQVDVPAGLGSRPPRHSKTKAMRDAPWRSLKPKSFPGKSLSTPRTQKVAARPPKKKRKASSGQAVQFTVPDHEDSAEEVPRRHVRSHGSREDSVDMPPPSQYTLKKRVQARDQSDESETPEDSDSSDKSEECNDDLQNLNSRELAHTFENEAIQWDGRGLQSSQRTEASRNRNKPEDGSEDKSDNGCSESEHAIEGILTQRAASRCAEALEFSDAEEEDLDPNCPGFSGSHNVSWPKAPFLPAGPGQRNIRINAQPTHLKDILKHAIKCLIRDCAFKHGYIPVDSQTECLVRILVLSAKALDRPYYTEWVQKDTVIQGVVCDLLMGRVSQYRTNIKRIAFSLVTHGYSLSDNQTEREKQVESLLLKDKFIFEPKEGGINPKKPFHHPVIIKTIHEAFFKRRRSSSLAQKYPDLFTSSIDTGAGVDELELPPAMVAMAAVAVHASLDEKVTGLDFNADIYEDSYNTFIAFLDEIRTQKLPAYHRLMSDLYQLVSNRNTTHTRNTSQNAMWLLDMDGMDV
ncbi:hypothetical protein V8E53_009738 [Lactarius tabidus]